MNHQKITVVTVCYNAERDIEKTIQSVINQTYDNIEYIIVDGASKDGTMQVVEKYKDKIAKIVSEPDKGIYDAMNKGIKLATGEWINFMNAGDCFYDNDSVANSVPMFNDTDIISGISTLSGQTWYPTKPSGLSLTFFLTKSLSQQATFIKTNLMKKHGYDTTYKSASDSLFFFEALIIENVSYQDISVMVARCDDAGMSGNEEQGYRELSDGIKRMLPPRMTYEVDFIHKYHNPAVLTIGAFLQKCTFLKRILKYYRRHRKNR